MKKKLLMLLVTVIAVLGLTACSYEATYTIHEDGSVDIEAMPWYSIDDLKQIVALEMQFASSMGTELDAEAQARLDEFDKIDTIEDLIAFVKAENPEDDTFDSLETKVINGVTYMGSREESQKETYPAEYAKELEANGIIARPDAFELNTDGMADALSEMLGGGAGLDPQSALELQNMLQSTNFLLTIEMPDEIVSTNGELSKDKKSVFFNINLGGKNEKFYAYTKDSKNIIDLGIADDAAYTRKKTLKVSSADKISYVKVNGKKISGKKISLKEDGKYTIEVKTKNSEKKLSFIKDSTKPVVTGVENGKTYTDAVTINFSDATSGIKSAKLGKKKVKDGVKVTKAGTYTLKITDKAGNKTTVKFTIKK